MKPFDIFFISLGVGIISFFIGLALNLGQCFGALVEIAVVGALVCAYINKKYENISQRMNELEKADRRSDRPD